MLKYEKIALDIEAEIQEKNLPQGTKLPIIEEFMTTYQVSKSTIIKALTTLEGKGAIFQVRGSGVFVRRKKRQDYVNLLSHRGFTKDLENYNLSTKLIWLKCIVPNEYIVNHLNCSEEEEVYAVKRIRYSNSRVICLEESYYKKSLVTYLNAEIVNDSIFYYIESVLGIKINFSDKYLNVGELNEKQAKYLNLPVSAPALFIDELYHTTNGEPLNFSKTIYHYKHSQFFIQTTM